MNGIRLLIFFVLSFGLFGCKISDTVKKATNAIKNGTSHVASLVHPNKGGDGGSNAADSSSETSIQESAKASSVACENNKSRLAFEGVNIGDTAELDWLRYSKIIGNIPAIQIVATNISNDSQFIPRTLYWSSSREASLRLTTITSNINQSGLGSKSQCLIQYKAQAVAIERCGNESEPICREYPYILHFEAGGDVVAIGDNATQTASGNANIQAQSIMLPIDCSKDVVNSIRDIVACTGVILKYRFKRLAQDENGNEVIELIPLQ